MDDRKPKAKDDDEPVIDPGLKEKGASNSGEPSSPPIGNAGKRRENETDANRNSDGNRKRAEEGL
ncbi:MAG: hypothetical protein Q7T86_18315 [Hyphomicrobiaceae bacterium]|nr:hypothetical protein [Hyphomicrobiaceae bacterium]